MTAPAEAEIPDDQAREDDIRAERLLVSGDCPWRNVDIDCLLRQLDRARAQRDEALSCAKTATKRLEVSLFVDRAG